ncbi:uncharacterized protein TrAFT101_008465 [Trichoderma asperellum]|uniref:DUF7702 domain-containing protein n=1 Tax=Trichoderma asperellum (strain ATCC 204424 / CBS 433.97 / NBRC 101777) TaxID=1042311 RepID=A0A2T3ZCA5_TRIA4|nr:hypothetical protein M441DRAFT_456571 [Trichoderma asperellum CBS 433.97]PTB42441.1 hypothetical protein M441DRAFT_456571 [Trichoderma asperellum CBS 433.97]UKZ93554.1 hypothetical protein TrAFT101_008465 [Trichoderma asperellum]
MTATSTAELAIYATLSIPNIYILLKHGRSGLLGWAYLLAFCTLRIVGGAMDLSGSTSAGIISSVGLSPLLLAASGILQEARAYYSDPLSKKMKWAAVLVFHGIVTTGVALLAVGASNLDSSDAKSSDASTNASLVKVGIALLTLSWAIIAIVSVWTLARPATCSKSKSATAAGTKLLWSVLVSNVFSGIRVIYALVALVTQDKSLSLLTGSLTIRVILSLIPELISVLAFITAGLFTRNAARDSLKAKRAPGRNGRTGAEI